MKKYLNIIRALSTSDFKLKYYGSPFGLLWSFLKPLLMLIILYVVFYYFLGMKVEHYVWHLLLGIIFWNFFSDTTKDVMQSVNAKAHILKNVNVPPFIVIASTLVHSFWTFLIGLGVFLVLFFAFGMPFSMSMLILPVLVLLLVLLTAGVSLLIITPAVRFKDFEHIWDVFLQMLFWITPIAYQYSLVSPPYLSWYLLNPLTRVLVEARDAIFGAFPPLAPFGITVLIILLILLLGVAAFKRHGRTIIEYL